MNIIGTIFFVDEKHMDVLQQNLSTMAPPGMPGVPNNMTMLCIDMSEEDDQIEQWFPNHSQKGTLLTPPPSALYKQIDGDQEGFIVEYNNYLDNDQSVRDFVASMLYYLHIGGNILLYTPTEMDADSIWLNTLRLWFYSRFGITIGTGLQDSFAYDAKYDYIIANELYGRLGAMSVTDFIYSIGADITKVDPINMQKFYQEMEPFVMAGEDPFSILQFIQYNLLTGGSPAYKPAVLFGR